jgi:hypothetical protein
MKKPLHCVLLIILGWSAGSSRNQPRQALLHRAAYQMAVPRQESDLSVSVEVVKQSYCHVDLDSFSVKMDVKLRFTNVAGQPVILARQTRTPRIIRVSKSVEAARKGILEYEPNIDEFTREAPTVPKFGDVPDSRRFIVLKPGESYEVTVPSGVFGTMRPTSGRGLLARGTYLLQLGVSTWPYPSTPEEVRKLQARWRGVGHLASGVVYSDFVPFTIPDKFNNPRCLGS